MNKTLTFSLLQTGKYFSVSSKECPQCDERFFGWGRGLSLSISYAQTHTLFAPNIWHCYFKMTWVWHSQITLPSVVQSSLHVLAIIFRSGLLTYDRRLLKLSVIQYVANKIHLDKLKRRSYILSNIRGLRERNL